MYLNNWPKAEEAIGAFRKALLDGRITVSLREQLQKEADETELLISKGEEAVNAFCSQTISNARRLFICSTTPWGRYLADEERYFQWCLTVLKYVDPELVPRLVEDLERCKSVYD